MNLKEQQAEKALALNEVFREKLTSFNSSLKRILEKVNEKFRINNLYLEMARGERLDSAHFKKSYLKCGSPFFKDAHGDPAPVNEDYRYRKNVLKEFFPFDQPESSNEWKTCDKVKLIEGVKYQMVNYIISEQSKKICLDSRKTRGKTQKLKFITNNKDLQTSSISSIHKTILESFPEFETNWSIISFGDLNSKHSVSECMGMWYSYLSPSINREPFTEEETLAIENAVNEDNYESWEDVARLLDNRSALQTYLRYTSLYMKLCLPNVRWTPEEDKLLMDSIAKYSVGPNSIINWNKIGQDFPMRSKTQCYNRYLIIIKYRNCKRGTFSGDEDRIILDYVKKHGEEKINKLPLSSLPGRSITQIRNHYNMSLKIKAHIQPWTREEDKQLIEFVESNGCDFSKLASIMKTHSRISCRTRFQTIRKFLDKNPKKTLNDVPSRNKLPSMKKDNSVNADGSINEEFSIVEFTEKEKESVRCRILEKIKKENFELYYMLLPCFNLDFGQRNLDVDERDALVLMKMLHVSSQELHIPKSLVSFTNMQLETIVRLRKSNEEPLEKTAISGSNMMIPPSLTTSAGLRAVYVKTKDCHKTLEDFNFGHSEQFTNSLKEFQERFIALFYWTALTSRLNLEELRQLSFMRNPMHNPAMNIFVAGTRKRKNLKQTLQNSE